MGDFVGNPNANWSIGLGIGQYVAQRFDVTQESANSAFNLTQDYIGYMGDLLGTLQTPDTQSIEVASPNVPALSFANRPRLGDLNLPTNWPINTSEKPELIDLPAITPYSIPVMSIAPPVWNSPEKPTLSMPHEPGVAPDIGAVILPEAPSFSLPAPPSLPEITLPVPPDISIPDFDSSFVDETINLPDGFSWQESPYNSEIWVTLLDKVRNGIIDGGDALSEKIEQELQTRALLRQTAENDRVWREAVNTLSAYGFELPPGALAARQMEISKQITHNNTLLNAEILAGQAQLMKEHEQFLIDKGLQIETVLREFHNAQEGRMFEAAKVIASNAIEIYNALVQRYNSRLEKYKTDAVVFETRVRAALSKAEIFKAQVEAARVSAEVQEKLVELYNAQLSGIQTQMKLYVAEVDGAKIKSDIELSKLEAFKIRTQAYVSMIEAERLKIDIYKAELDGEQGKADVYKSQVQAFLAEVDSVKAGVELQGLEIDAVSKRNTAEIDRYRAELKAWETEINALATEIKGLVSGFQAEATAYSAETEAEGMRYGAIIKEIEARIMESRFKLEKGVAEIDASIKGYLGIKELNLKGTEAVMNVGAQLTASAWNAVNASMSMSEGSSRGLSESWSHGENISESHNYEEA